MEKDTLNNSEYSKVLKIANSPEGQRLLSLIRQYGGDSLPRAMEQAEQGDYADAREIIARFLDDPEAKDLVEKIRGNP